MIRCHSSFCGLNGWAGAKWRSKLHVIACSPNHPPCLWADVWIIRITSLSNIRPVYTHCRTLYSIYGPGHKKQWSVRFVAEKNTNVAQLADTPLQQDWRATPATRSNLIYQYPSATELVGQARGPIPRPRGHHNTAARALSDSGPIF